MPGCPQPGATSGCAAAAAPPKTYAEWVPASRPTRNEESAAGLDAGRSVATWLVGGGWRSREGKAKQPPSDRLRKKSKTFNAYNFSLSNREPYCTIGANYFCNCWASGSWFKRSLLAESKSKSSFGKCFSLFNKTGSPKTYLQ